MDARQWGLAMAIAALACAPPEGRLDGRLVQQGRIYTEWLYGSEYDKLWERFSPEMRQTFGSVADLASFAGGALKHLGAERNIVDESVKEAERFLVYSRAASFKKAEHPMLIEWSLAPDGAVTGLVVRPAPQLGEK
ncbi:MAG: hypothetical protein ACREMZ_06850 [Gemmatimonadales bacterium]